MERSQQQGGVELVLDKTKDLQFRKFKFLLYERIFSKIQYTPVGFVGAAFKGLFYTDTSEK